MLRSTSQYFFNVSHRLSGIFKRRGCLEDPYFMGNIVIFVEFLSIIDTTTFFYKGNVVQAIQRVNLLEGDGFSCRKPSFSIRVLALLEQ